MKTTINVTANDIAKGLPHQPVDCPIALAIQRRLKPKVVAMVGPDNVDIGGKVRLLPVRAAIFTTKFDDRQPVVPFKFKLDIPEKFLK